MKRGIIYFGTFLIVLGFIALAFITKNAIFIYLSIIWTVLSFIYFDVATLFC